MSDIGEDSSAQVLATSLIFSGVSVVPTSIFSARLARITVGATAPNAILAWLNVSPSLFPQKATLATAIALRGEVRVS